MHLFSLMPYSCTYQKDCQRVFLGVSAPHALIHTESQEHVSRLTFQGLCTEASPHSLATLHTTLHYYFTTRVGAAPCSNPSSQSGLPNSRHQCLLMAPPALQSRHHLLQGSRRTQTFYRVCNSATGSSARRTRFAQLNLVIAGLR